jgi:hypothetical protein
VTEIADRIAEVKVRAERFLVQCGSCDYGFAMGCTCPPGDPRSVLSDLLELVEKLAEPTSAEQVVEHAIEMSSGAMQVRYEDPEIERIYPLADWIKAQQRFGGKVWRRTVIVVEDWHEMPSITPASVEAAARDSAVPGEGAHPCL